MSLAALKTFVEQSAERNPEEFYGHDWWQITAAEVEVFEIDLVDMPRLVGCWSAYEEVTEMAISGLFSKKVLAAARAELPWAKPYDLFQFQRFAALVGVSQRNADAFFYKYQFWQTRNDHRRFRDEDEQPD